MKTTEEFNKKYTDYLEEGHYGLAIGDEAIIMFLDKVFQDLIKIPGFKYSQIKVKFINSRVYTNLHEILPSVGGCIENYLEKRIDEMLKK